MNIFGTDTENNFFTRVEILVEIADKVYFILGEKHFFKTELNVNFFFVADERAGKEVHLGRSDESRNELVDRIIVKIDRSIYLLHKAVFHNDDSGTHGHCFDLVVGNVNKGSV